jgi:hypothetical protein
MSWWQLFPTLVCAAAVVFVPGYLILRCWAVRGLVAVAAAAPVSLGIVGAMAVAGPFLGVRWGIALVAVPALVFALTGLVLRWFAPRALGVDRAFQRPRVRWTMLVHLGAVLVPAVLLGRGLTAMIGFPENVSQTYDNIFHLNAIRYILDSGSGSSLTLGGMYSNGANPSAYPAAWHDLVSLVVQLSGATIPASINAVTLVIGGLVWPISCIFLATRVTGVKPVPVLIAGALSAAFGAFPYLMVDFGVLYPYFLSLALLPAALALVAMLFGVGESGGTPRWVVALALLAALAGIALAHPSTAMASLLLSVPVLLHALVRFGRRGARLWLACGVVLFLAYLAVVVTLWQLLRPSAAASAWKPIQSVAQAMGEVLSAGLIHGGPSWVVLVLTLVAVSVAGRGAMSGWLIGAYLITAVLFLVVSSGHIGEFRSFVAGVWYNDSYRLAAILPTMMVAVCTVAGSAMLTWALTKVRLGPAPTPAAAGVVFLAAIVLGVSGQYSSVNYEVQQGSYTYQSGANSPLMSPDERALLDRLGKDVPKGDTIIGNPWTGTSLAYAIADRRTLTPHAGNTVPPETLALMDHLENIRKDDRICSTVRKLHSYYVLDFPGPTMHDVRIDFPGLDDLRDNPALRVVDRQGPATLYRITGC